MRALALILLIFGLVLQPLHAADKVEKVEKTEKTDKESGRIAIAQIERITSDLDYEKVRLLSLDKDTRDALRQINQELKQVRSDVLALTDDLKLMDYQKKMEFLNRKKSLIHDRSTSRDSSRDMRKLARDFIVERYKDKYLLILSEGQNLERNTLHKSVAVDDITDEVSVKFREYLTELVGE